MNKNIVGIVLIVLALLAVYLYGWPKIQPYLQSPPPETVPQGAPAQPEVRV